jgi:hypothetical protein
MAGKVYQLLSQPTGQSYVFLQAGLLAVLHSLLEKLHGIV